MYKLIYKIFLGKIDAEKSHKIGIFMLKYFSFLFKNSYEQEVNFFNKKIVNPIGIAAGFDKNGEVIKPLFNIGFGFVEIGTVTPKPQYGNQKPRIFRIENNAGIVNRMGFPNLGGAEILKNLKKFNSKKNENQIVGVNIGRNKEGGEQDYLDLIELFIKDADYIAINISSPNTPGLRNLLEEKPLFEFLKLIKEKRQNLQTKKPFFLKISPDINPENLTFIYKAIVENKIEGIIIANTTLSRSGLNLKNELESGGLSGKFLKEKSLDLLKKFNEINKDNIFVISVGGIETKQEAELRLKNGANLVQIYTGFIFTGPNFITKFKD